MIKLTSKNWVEFFLVRLSSCWAWRLSKCSISYYRRSFDYVIINRFQ